MGGVYGYVYWSAEDALCYDTPERTKLGIYDIQPKENLYGNQLASSFAKLHERGYICE
jgi:hypothetical protein